MQADWKHKHKNKLKVVKTTHQTHCRGRQAGAATTGVARHDQVQVEGVSTNRWHRDVDAGVGTGTQMQADWECEHKNKVKRETTTHQTHCRSRQAGVAITGVARHGWVQVGRCRVQAGRWMQGRMQGQAGVCRSAGVSIGNQAQMGGGMDRHCQT